MSAYDPIKDAEPSAWALLLSTLKGLAIVIAALLVLALALNSIPVAILVGSGIIAWAIRSTARHSPTTADSQWQGRP